MKIGNVFGDGAYDTTDAANLSMISEGRQIIPPKRKQNCREKNPLPALKRARQGDSENQGTSEKRDRAKWKQEIGYHRRSLVETHMFRYKTILGDRLTARKGSTQATEAAIKCDVLNRMIELGMPDSYKVVV